MGRFADFIRCHILEEYTASYMRERGADAMLVLRNENKWAMTGKYYDIFPTKFQFDIFFICQIQFSERNFVAFSRF